MKLTPASIAACSVRIDSWSSTAPHDPPIAHAPKLIVDTLNPVRPNARYSIPAPATRIESDGRLSSRPYDYIIRNHELNSYSWRRHSCCVRDARRAVAGPDAGHAEGAVA